MSEDDRREVRKLGPDHLRVEPDRLVIRSPVDMPDWQVRDFRKPMIRHDGRAWELVAKVPGAGDTIRYDLVPWPEDRTDLPGGVIEYDEAYVSRRDAATGEAGGGAGLAALLLRPLLGLLPARVKIRLERKGYGSAVEATAASLILEWILVLLCGAASTIAVFAGGLSGQAVLGVDLGTPLIGAAAVLGIDALARWSRAQEDPLDVAGFWEWLWTRRTSAAVDSKNRADTGD